MSELAERLGHPADARIVIVTADDLGLSQSVNTGCFDVLREGAATSASLMVPAPWAREAASQYRGEDVGVHLTLNAEHDRYRWRPITHAPSLLDGDGGFPRTVADLWDHADLDESRRELRAQIERAILWGFDVTHLTSHLDALQLRPEFFDVYVDLACEFGLPIRLAGPEVERAVGFPFRGLADAEGVVFCDRVADLPRDPTAAAVADLVARIEPGVTEIRLRPAADTPEQRAFDPRSEDRFAARRAAGPAGTLADALADAGATRIGFRPLRDLVARA